MNTSKQQPASTKLNCESKYIEEFISKSTGTINFEDYFDYNIIDEQYEIKNDTGELQLQFSQQSDDKYDDKFQITNEVLNYLFVRQNIQDLKFYVIQVESQNKFYQILVANKKGDFYFQENQTYDLKNSQIDNIKYMTPRNDTDAQLLLILPKELKEFPFDCSECQQVKQIQNIPPQHKTTYDILNKIKNNISEKFNTLQSDNFFAGGIVQPIKYVEQMQFKYKFKKQIDQWKKTYQTQSENTIQQKIQNLLKSFFPIQNQETNHQNHIYQNLQKLDKFFNEQNSNYKTDNLLTINNIIKYLISLYYGGFEDNITDENFKNIKKTFNQIQQFNKIISTIIQYNGIEDMLNAQQLIESELINAQFEGSPPDLLEKEINLEYLEDAIDRKWIPNFKQTKQQFEKYFDIEYLGQKQSADTKNEAIFKINTQNIKDLQTVYEKYNKQLLYSQQYPLLEIYMDHYQQLTQGMTNIQYMEFLIKTAETIFRNNSDEDDLKNRIQEYSSDENKNIIQQLIEQTFRYLLNNSYKNAKFYSVLYTNKIQTKLNLAGQPLRQKLIKSAFIYQFLFLEQQLEKLIQFEVDSIQKYMNDSSQKTYFEDSKYKLNQPDTFLEIYNDVFGYQKYIKLYIKKYHEINSDQGDDKNPQKQILKKILSQYINYNKYLQRVFVVRYDDPLHNYLKFNAKNILKMPENQILGEQIITENGLYYINNKLQQFSNFFQITEKKSDFENKKWQQQTIIFIDETPQEETQNNPKKGTFLLAFNLPLQTILQCLFSMSPCQLLPICHNNQKYQQYGFMHQIQIENKLLHLKGEQLYYDDIIRCFFDNKKQNVFIKIVQHPAIAYLLQGIDFDLDNEILEKICFLTTKTQKEQYSTLIPGYPDPVIKISASMKEDQLVFPKETIEELVDIIFQEKNMHIVFKILEMMLTDIQFFIPKENVVVVDKQEKTIYVPEYLVFEDDKITMSPNKALIKTISLQEDESQSEQQYLNSIWKNNFEQQDVKWNPQSSDNYYDQDDQSEQKIFVKEKYFTQFKFGKQWQYKN